MTNSNSKQIVDEKNGVMIRVDKTLKEMMDEKPSSRWDVDYWQPRFDSLFNDIKFKLQILGDFIFPGTKGITYGSTKPREWSKKENGVGYIKSVNVRNTGLDTVNIFWTPEGGNLDGKQYRIKIDDIIMNKSGTGTFGRLFVVIKELGKIVVSQDTMRIRVKGISPYFVAVYLQSNHGINQILRLTAGVSGQVHIDFEDIKSIKIPMLPREIQEQVSNEYKKLAEYHEKAMEAKKENNESEYQRNLKTAEEMLNNLIKKTEQVIRGERKDVV